MIPGNGLIQRMIGGMLEQMLQKEMNEYLGYEKHSLEGHLLNSLVQFVISFIR